MDFFEAQETARRRTGLLIALFAAAVVSIIVAVYLVTHVALGRGAGVDWVLLGQVAFGVGVIVAGGSGSRIAGLRRGGPAVAEILGGRRVATDTTVLEERRLINVVEEMAIASGTPVPAIYVLDREDAINAFAAGYTIHDAAVAVTRGALRELDRDELQGVIAHEFSHILNGDMRLNIRLIGMLHGILLLALVGRGILRVGPRTSVGRRGKSGGGAGAVVLVALALLVVGYLGVLFGRLIQAAVSRQREFLADSAGVEFTRNPMGLAGALKKIRTNAQGSRLNDHRAQELSHLFFANGVREAMFAFLSTHPPLEARIARLEPSWQPEERAAVGAAVGGEAELGASSFNAPGAPIASPDAAGPPLRTEAPTPAGVLGTVGSPTPAGLAYAGRLLSQLPDELRAAVHQPQRAAPLVLALLLAAEESTGEERALQALASRTSAEVQRAVRELLPAVRATPREQLLPLLDLSLPALDTLSPEEGERLLSAAEAAAWADSRLRLMELTLLHVLRRRVLGPMPQDRHGATVGSLADVGREAELLLSAISWVGSGWNADDAREAFREGAAEFWRHGASVELQPQERVSVEAIDKALTRLREGNGKVRRSVLQSCLAAAARDGTIDNSEMEILRAVSEALDCPLPPIVR